ncbi:enoyl-CoA hydratase/isomerase family protein [Arenibaculum pallidiluteum]|uniref:enoyl-CoA hydratase/isomerase family protein n=1 Tax=Arenibaculum pallidiluteum TaxID=2812559 RepID=UPI001A97148E|nr:enoyl-CoA hydratase/isomerase family protein [Arenibaculum pallidiluteum]
MVPRHLSAERRGPVLVVRIDRPEKRNALSVGLLEALRTTFEGAAAEDGIRLAVLTGAGDRSFAAGGDLRELDAVRGRAEAETMAATARAALDAVRRLPVPVVAALNGDALGGGAELAMACDFRVAAHHARLGFVQGRLNLSTGWGGGIDLIRLVGPSAALRLLTAAEILDASAARACGLVDSVADPGQDLDAAVEAFAAPILARPAHVLRSVKALVRAAREGAPRAELDAVEHTRFVECWLHEDHWEAASRVLARGS